MHLIFDPNPWSNWSGRQTATPRLVANPRQEDDFVALVRAAREQGLTIRAVGASHSHSRVAAPDGALVVTDDWQGLVDVDGAHQNATFRSGTRIFQTGPLLHQHGLALRNQGDIDKQSLAGATATGTHGTGPGLQNLSASIEQLRLVTASGEIITCGPHLHSEIFNAAATFPGWRRTRHRTDPGPAGQLSPPRAGLAGASGRRDGQDRRFGRRKPALRVLLDARSRPVRGQDAHRNRGHRPPRVGEPEARAVGLEPRDHFVRTRRAAHRDGVLRTGGPRSGMLLRASGHDPTRLPRSHLAARVPNACRR